MFQNQQHIRKKYTRQSAVQFAVLWQQRSKTVQNVQSRRINKDAALHKRKP